MKTDTSIGLRKPGMEHMPPLYIVRKNSDKYRYVQYI
jgi:hypothetical protein